MAAVVRVVADAVGKVPGPVLAVATGLVGYAGYAAKDLEGRPRRVLRTVSVLGTAAVSAAVLCRPEIREDVFPRGAQPRAKAAAEPKAGEAAGCHCPELDRADVAELAVSAGILVAERVVAHKLRRTSLKRPGALAGALIGLERVACTQLMLRRWQARQARTRGDQGA